MAYEERDNSGIIFKNSYKKTDAQPDYTGKGMIGGVEGRFSMWIKQGAKGPFMSLAFTPNEETGQSAPAPKATSSQSKPMTKAPVKSEASDDEEDFDFVPF